MLRFREGFPYLDICRAAVAGDGILRADGAAAERYGAVYRELRPQRKVVKFVPASGAATRMFKALFEFFERRRSQPRSRRIVGRSRPFRFCRTACGVYRRQPRSANRGLEYPDRRARLRTLPKALILFTVIPTATGRPLKNIWPKGAVCGRSRSEVCIHFTVSAEHREQFERLAAETVPFYEARFGVKYRIGYSCQKPSTDTLAVNPTIRRCATGRGACFSVLRGTGR